MLKSIITALLMIFSFLCSLSVTKWVHLNWGDDGLITLFSKIWRLLQPVTILWLNQVPIICFSYVQLTVGFAFQGGIFVMEPQPWKSYENNRRVSEVCIYANFFLIAQVSLIYSLSICLHCVFADNCNELPNDCFTTRPFPRNSS